MDLNTIKSTLTNLVNAKEICCLCLRDTSEEYIGTKDIVYVPLNNVETWVAFDEILEEILNEDETEFSLFSNTVCKDCYSVAISTYKLIDKWHSTKLFLSKLVGNVAQCFIDDPPKYTSAVYVSVNHEVQCTASYKKHRKLKAQKSLSMQCKNAKKRKTSEIRYFDINIKLEPSNCDELSEEDKLLCEVCSLECPSKKVMKMHYLKEHAPKIYTCDKCPKTFAADHLLKRHIRTNHHGVVCSECGKMCNSVHSLKTHQYTHQSLSCKLCGHIYKTISGYKKHISTMKCLKQKDTNLKTLEKMYQCDTCQKSYVNKMTLKTHMKFEHGDGKYLKCHWCDKKFYAQSRLNIHIVTHTKEKNFPCDTCGGKFVTKEALLYHTRIHTGETPYACPHCPLSFLSTSRRMDHIRRKHAPPSQPCELCPRLFTTASAMRKHRRKHFDPNSRLFKKPEGFQEGT